MKGSHAADDHGVYGLKGVASGANIPGAASRMTGALGADNTFFLFGGEGYARESYGLLKDLWTIAPVPTAGVDWQRYY
jgi:hypothetical protein